MIAFLNALFGFLLMTSIFGLYYLMIKHFLSPEKAKEPGPFKFYLILAFFLKIPFTVLALYLLVTWSEFSVGIFLGSFILGLILWSGVLITCGSKTKT